MAIVFVLRPDSFLTLVLYKLFTYLLNSAVQIGKPGDERCNVCELEIAYRIF